MNLTGTLPSCLLSTPGTLSQIGFSSNNLTGSIPDVIPVNSSLYSLVLNSNNLTGSIPSTLVNAQVLSDVELYSNRLAGSIPSEFGAEMYMLDTVLLSSNNLTGEHLTALLVCIAQCSTSLCAAMRCLVAPQCSERYSQGHTPTWLACSAAVCDSTVPCTATSVHELTLCNVLFFSCTLCVPAAAH